MADEPTGNLDSKNGRLVLDLLLQLNQREKTTLLLVTHDRELAAFADRIITLRDGEIAGCPSRTANAACTEAGAWATAPSDAGPLREGPHGGL